MSTSIGGMCGHVSLDGGSDMVMHDSDDPLRLDRTGLSATDSIASMTPRELTDQSCFPSSPRANIVGRLFAEDLRVTLNCPSVDVGCQQLIRPWLFVNDIHGNSDSRNRRRAAKSHFSSSSLSFPSIISTVTNVPAEEREGASEREKKEDEEEILSLWDDCLCMFSPSFHIPSEGKRRRVSDDSRYRSSVALQTTRRRVLTTRHDLIQRYCSCFPLSLLSAHTLSTNMRNCPIP